MYRPLNIIIAGGGTGGHLFPGIAVAREFMARNPESRVLFVSTGRPLELEILTREGFSHQRINVSGLKGMGLFGKLRAVMKIPGSIWSAFGVLRRFAPDLVVGVGGYSSGPVVLAARWRGIACVLQEQNILPGITNRLLSRWVDRIYVSFQETRFTEGHAPAIWTGNPVRKEISYDDRVPGIFSVDSSSPPFGLLVLGGSQGAHSINQAMVDAAGRMGDIGPLRIVHQTGIQDAEMVRAAYDKYGISSDVRAFFNDMPEQYRKADLIVCRAGATTVAEISAVGKASIFIPFPHAADNHQELNARTRVAAGAAELILEKDLDGESLVNRIRRLVEHPDDLRDMAERARCLGRPDAAAEIVDDCYQLLEKRV
ncbi:MULTISPECIES: undecaprenyldiphospho-muramoylpentapeptide beta-N-acetylglucosaminyltransferase [Desulfococcus]|uniref:UDP-N-acetylglucosamine--N-acetylmuramyl-(pentapeptide) pyrophosphoryl-undecaprenol N-acetylglucosamine transferase n=1 Tax=Desulfococcus multivorans DSM 2059 TaxID=1121405 RepID=S7UK60_DESML|nr:undecaprenyldiphospho-muramoylpentapeptide beta-N-acetylglucosaminyltransferase [Desulfococcus multivorans]AOY59548.1 MurG: undecaprenyldiphospho-muramoylpentapeptide beta-N-acetylglucosaminyltransferase [Desulfococcus multivorans]AQV01742.1 undecaprenyldiphospho-muramoylpentapeptide beta-N- acetylglucosaminyltransferase [Desulfococcus multivorans]EPR34194.1 UDP/pyrophosphoryl-undecaprenol N-acetylglucosamine transferase [Desulfococcus multivorans DSM 2059]SKA19989.1 UDP-N-acetylglucosamine-